MFVSHIQLLSVTLNKVHLFICLFNTPIYCYVYVVVKFYFWFNFFDFLLFFSMLLYDNEYQTLNQG